MATTTGLEIRVEVKAATAVLPPWWEFFSAGTCREASLTFVNSLQLASGSCVNWGPGNQGGIAAYNIGQQGPNTAVLLAAIAVPEQSPAHLNALTEYVAGGLEIDHALTVGAPTCAGCDVPVCIVFSSLNVVGPPALADDRFLTQGANSTSSQFVRWQNGTVQNLDNSSCRGTFDCNTQFDCVIGVTGTRRSAWG